MNALSRVREADILFFDIETAAEEETIVEGTARYDSWAYYCRNNDIEDIVGSYEKKAALYAEYSQVVCITVGVFVEDEVRIRTIKGDEQKILKTFQAILEAKGNYILCAHGGKNFDIPFLMKRYIINGLELPKEVDVSGKKPWEIPHLDTAELWKGSGWKSSSLVSICLALGIDSPKGGIDGSDVTRVFHEGGIDEIVKYCERDVDALIKVYKRLV